MPVVEVAYGEDAVGAVGAVGVAGREEGQKALRRIGQTASVHVPLECGYGDW